MSTPSKALKRLGIVGAAALAGLVPVAVTAAPAYAVATSPAPSLTLSSTVTAATATATNVFTTNTINTAPGSVTVCDESTGGPGDVEGLPPAADNTDYSVSWGLTVFPPTAADITTAPCPNAPTFTAVTIAGLPGIPSGTQVTVQISGITNAAAPTQVFFADQTSGDVAVGNPPVSTNYVSITSSPAATSPTVSSVNPSAFVPAGGENFTVTGATFSTTTVPADEPVVCFVESGTSDPIGAATQAAVCPSTTVDTVITHAPATEPLVTDAPTELQSTSPALTAGVTYNVVVYNYDSTTGLYDIAPSATSANTLVTAAVPNAAGDALNFVPEAGVRAINTSTGLGGFHGAIPSGAAEYFPLADFQYDNANGTPTNVPTTATGLSVNVTAVAPSGVGNLQVYSTASTVCTSPPSTSTVNFQPPQDTNNSTILSLTGTNGICVQDNGASVNVDIDVTGYTTAGFTPDAARILNTEPSKAIGIRGALASDSVTSFATGLAPGTYVFNLTDVAPSGVGNLRVFPEPASGPPAASGAPQISELTYIPKTDGSALVVLEVPISGNIDLYNDSPGTVNVIMDEVGMLQSGVAPAITYSSLTGVAAPYRVLQKTAISSGATANVTASPSGSGSSFVPSGAVAVFGSLGDINPPSVGNLQTYPEGTTESTTPSSAINNYPSQTRSTGALEALNPTNGGFTILSDGSSTTVTFDVFAYIAGLTAS